MNTDNPQKKKLAVTELESMIAHITERTAPKTVEPPPAPAKVNEDKDGKDKEIPDGEELPEVGGDKDPSEGSDGKDGKDEKADKPGADKKADKEDKKDKEDAGDTRLLATSGDNSFYMKRVEPGVNDNLVVTDAEEKEVWKSQAPITDTVGLFNALDQAVTELKLDQVNWSVLKELGFFDALLSEKGDEDEMGDLEDLGDAGDFGELDDFETPGVKPLGMGLPNESRRFCHKHGKSGCDGKGRCKKCVSESNTALLRARIRRKLMAEGRLPKHLTQDSQEDIIKALLEKRRRARLSVREGKYGDILDQRRYAESQKPLESAKSIAKSLLQRLEKDVPDLEKADDNTLRFADELDGITRACDGRGPAGGGAAWCRRAVSELEKLPLASRYASDIAALKQALGLPGGK